MKDIPDIGNDEFASPFALAHYLKNRKFINDRRLGLVPPRIVKRKRHIRKVLPKVACSSCEASLTRYPSLLKKYKHSYCNKLCESEYKRAHPEEFIWKRGPKVNKFKI